MSITHHHHVYQKHNNFPIQIRLVDSSLSGGELRKYVFEESEITDEALEDFVVRIRSGQQGFETRSRDVFTYVCLLMYN